MERLLSNLLSNSVKYTPKGGSVIVSARIDETPGWVRLVVEDTGYGIPPENLPHIFDRFYRVRNAQTNAAQGLGLGLYICKELVTRQGGQIWATSAQGQGAVFSFTLPVFSLSNLIAPAIRNKRRKGSPITLVVTEIGSQTGWLSGEVRAQQFHGIRDLLQRCLHSDLDVLLPKMGSARAVELFFIVAITDGIGGEAITKRIREQLDGWEHFKDAGLTFSTAYRSLEAIKQNAHESLDSFLERIAGKIQKLIDEEISLRMVEND